jgi:hypothetical protein
MFLMFLRYALQSSGTVVYNLSQFNLFEMVLRNTDYRFAGIVLHVGMDPDYECDPYATNSNHSTYLVAGYFSSVS